MCRPDPQRAHHRQMQRIHLTPCLPSLSRPFAPCTWPPCSATRVFSPGDLLRLMWSTCRGVPCAQSTILDVTLASLMGSHSVVLWSFVVHAYAAMDGGAGVENEMSYRNVLSGAQVFCYCVSACRQLRLPTSRGKRQLAWCCLRGWPVPGKGVRTGGRLHPGLAGERLPKQRPKPCSCFRRPRGCGALPRRRPWFLWVPSAHRGLLRACLPARLAPVRCSHARQVLVRLSRTVSLPSCVLAALGCFAPVVLPDLGPLPFSLHYPGHPVWGC